jgi:hypothetical protein
MHWLAWLAAFIVIGYGGICLAMYLFQAKLVYFPMPEVAATPADAGLAYEDVAFTASDGVELHGWFVPAPEHEAEPLAVLFCHGNAGNIGHRLDTLRILHELGLAAFIFDYRGYGNSGGRPGEQGTYLDAAAAWEHLTGQRGVAPGRVVAWGRSLGGAVAAWVAAQRDPAAVILESTFTSVPDMGARLYPFLPVRPLARIRYDTEARLADITCPVLVIHSPSDDIVPFALGRQLYERAKEPKSFLEIGGGHNEGYLLDAAAYARGVDRFLDSVRARDGRGAQQ